MTKLRWYLPLLSAVLFLASYHPLNLGPLGFVCLVPLLIYSQVTSGKKSFFVAWASGYFAFAMGYLWFAYTVPIGLGIPLWLPAIWGIAALFVKETAVWIACLARGDRLSS